MMTGPETEFQLELRVFGNEVNEAIQSFYAGQTVHNVARQNEQVYDALNRHAPFWNVVLRALQANSMIVLGRVFDKDSRSHSVERLPQFAEANPEIFSKLALEKRKREQSTNADEWIHDYMRNAYIPNSRDFKRLSYTTNFDGHTLTQSVPQFLLWELRKPRPRLNVAQVFKT